MSKRNMFVAVALLALFSIAVSPVLAKTTEYYWAHHEMDMLDPGKIVKEDGITHVLGSYWNGTFVGSLGTGKLEIWFRMYTLNTVTGEGTASATILITIGGSTLKGTSRGKITDWYYGFGEFVCERGTGDFEGWRVKGSWTLTFTSLTHASIDCVGVTVHP